MHLVLLLLAVQTPSGWIVLDADPGTRVLLGQRELGSVPLGRTGLPAGKQTLTLIHQDQRRDVTVDVAPNDTRIYRIGKGHGRYLGHTTPTPKPLHHCRANPHVVGAIDLIDRLEFARAAQRLQRAIEHHANCEEDLVRVYELKGVIDTINQERERARRAFEIVRTLDPDFRIHPGAPAKIAQTWNTATPKTLTMNVAPIVEHDGWLRIRGDTKDELRLADHVRVLVDLPDDPHPITRHADLDHEGRFETRLPAVPHATIEIILADRWGGTLRRIRRESP